MKPTFKLKDLIQQGESAIAQYSQLIGQGMMAVDCSEVESLTEEQITQLFSGIPDSWDFVELAEVFDTDTFSQTIAEQFSELLNRRHGRQPHPQPLRLGQLQDASYADAGSDRSSEERGVKEQKALDILLESMGGIIHRTSLLDLGVRLSPHPAPEILGLRLAHVNVIMA